ncbi:MAG: hypothetical protein NVS9B3_15650 [Gemmatimonadaceae bacterium]
MDGTVRWEGWGMSGGPVAHAPSLPAAPGVWLAVVALLYIPCRWFADLRHRHPDSLLRYL